MADGSAKEALAAAPVLAVRALLSLLPWERRVAAAGWLGRLSIRRIGRLRRRVERNLSFVMPDLPAAERERILVATGDNFGRTVTEMLFAEDFFRRHPWGEPTGAGIEALRAAVREDRGAILVSGHFGQWEAGRAWVKEQGRDCGGVYRAVRNRHLERLYSRNIAFTGSPMFAKGRKSIRGIARHLGAGGIMAFLVDQHERRGVVLDFMGKPAPTTLIAAELALKYGLPMFPCYVPRRSDGVHMDFIVEAPISHTTAREMMQAFNDSLAAQVRAHPGQYYWLHRRWSKDIAD